LRAAAAAQALFDFSAGEAAANGIDEYAPGLPSSLPTKRISIKLAPASVRQNQATAERTDSTGRGSGAADPSAVTDERIEFWTKARVHEWLDALGLPQYRGVFDENEVGGATLLELTPDDLDYMGIRPLGHRKTLLRAVESLRAERRNALEVAAAADSSSRMSSVHAASASAAAARTTTMHWSQVPSRPAVAGSSLPSSTAAAGDAEDLRRGVYDEAAEAEAFKAAVMAWRKGNAAVARPDGSRSADGSATLLPPAASLLSSSSSGGVWVNPFFSPPQEAGAVYARPAVGSDAPAAPDGPLDEEAERRWFQEAVREWRGRPAAAAASSGTAAVSSAPPASGAPPVSGSSEAAPRSSCYQCFRILAGSEVYKPVAAAASAAVSEGILLLKDFCSEHCYDKARQAAAASATAAGSGVDGGEPEEAGDVRSRIEALRALLEAGDSENAACAVTTGEPRQETVVAAHDDGAAELRMSADSLCSTSMGAATSASISHGESVCRHGNAVSSGACGAVDVGTRKESMAEVSAAMFGAVRLTASPIIELSAAQSYSSLTSSSDGGVGIPAGPASAAVRGDTEAALESLFHAAEEGAAAAAAALLAGKQRKRG